MGNATSIGATLQSVESRSVRRWSIVAAVAGAAVLVCAGAVVAVSRRSSNGHAVAPVAIDARWSGCVRLDAVHCARDPRSPLHLFLPSTSPAVVSITDERGAAVSFGAVGAVLDRTVYAVAGEPRGTLRVTFVSQAYGVASVDDDPADAALGEIDALRKQGRFTEAVVAADARLERVTGRTAVRGWYLSARAAFASGDAASAATRFSRMAAQAKDLGFDDDEAIGRLAAAFVLSARLGKVTDALAFVDDADGFWSAHPQHRAPWLYYRASVFLNGASHRKAIADLEEAARLFRMLDNRVEALNATSALSTVFATLGRPADALALVASTGRDTLPKDGCSSFFFANNSLFASLRSAEKASPPWSRNEAARSHALAEAEAWIAFLRSFPPDACADRASLSLTRVHEAEHAKLRADTPTLDRLLREARVASERRLPVVDLAWLELELERAVDRNDVALAEKHAAKLLADGRALDNAHSVWAAHMGRARLHRARRINVSRSALESAEAELDRTVRDVAVGDGRNAFLSAHEASAAALFDLLLETRAFDDAQRVARSSARRALEAAATAFDATQTLTPSQHEALREYREVKLRNEASVAHDWELPVAEVTLAREARARALNQARRALEGAFANAGTLHASSVVTAPPPRGEAYLAVHPTPSGYAALLQTAGAFRVARVDEAVEPKDREAAAARLLQSATNDLPEGTLVHLTAYGPLRPLDWAKLPVDALGTTLLARFGLVEHLGLSDASPSPRFDTSYVIADATLDLPFSAREGAFVHARVPSMELRGNAATRLAVVEAFEHSDFVHYAGHGRFAGADGFESELLLAGGTALSVSDVLLLGHVPTIAVLSGCELARSDDAFGESFGIAQAMLARGSHFAVAPSRKVKDELAERFVHALYTEGSLTEETLPARVRGALRTLAREVPEEDWSTFRLLAR